MRRHEIERSIRFKCNDSVDSLRDRLARRLARRREVPRSARILRIRYEKSRSYLHLVPAGIELTGAGRCSACRRVRADCLVAIRPDIT